MNEDGLLDPVDEAEDQWILARDGSGDRLRDAVHAVGDVLATRQIVWPAARDGRLIPPPEDHVVDALVRRSLIYGESPEWDAVWDLRPRASTVILADGLSSTCDVCRARPARYDGHLAARRDFSAWLCPWCYQRRSTLRLGLAEGQFVMRYSEVSAAVWQRYVHACDIWRDRGAPVSSTDLRDQAVDDPEPLGPPFGYDNEPITGDIGQSFIRTVSLASVRSDPTKGLFPENLSMEEDGFVYWSRGHPADGVTQNVIFGSSAAAELDQCVEQLIGKAGVRERALPGEVRFVVAQHVAKVLLEGLRASKAIGRLDSSIKEHLGPTIVVAPVSGVSWDGPPAKFGDHFLIGVLGPEFQEALDEMSQCYGVATFRPEGGPRWTEDYEHLLEHPESYPEIEPFHPTTVAQAVDSTASVAIELMMQKVQALFGAIESTRALQEPDERGGPKLVVSGDETNGEEPWDEGTKIFTLERAGAHERDYGIWHLGDPILMDELSCRSAPITRVVAEWLPTDASPAKLSARIAACAKQFNAADEARDVNFTALHVAAAMEALLVRPEEEKAETLARRVGRILAVEHDGRAAIASEVKRLYRLRSDAAHLGLSTVALADRAAVIQSFERRLPQLLEAGAKACASGLTVDSWFDQIDLDDEEASTV